ncbi:hypothetical protein [Streptomyces sp. NPDC055794]
MTTGGESYYRLTDATGNVLGLADSTGQRTHTYAYGGPTGLPRTTPTESVPQPLPLRRSRFRDTDLHSCFNPYAWVTE